MEKTYNILKWIAGLLFLAVVILAAQRLYDTLAPQVQPQTLATAPTQPATEPESDETVPETTQSTAIPAPDFTVYNGAGEPVSLSDFKGTPVVLNFWASWCGPCKSEMPDFQKVYEEQGDAVAFLMVNLTDGMQETMESAAAFLEQSGYTFPVYFDKDTDAAMAYGVSAIPTTFFIDAQGNLRAYHQSVLSESLLRKGISMILPE